MAHPVLFTQESFDLICSDLEKFPLARAVAASNGFPGLFSPITLTNHAADCGGRRARLAAPRSAMPTRQDPLSRLGVQAQLADRYLDPEQTRYLHLVDGGVADNLALRGAGSSDAGARPGRRPTCDAAASYQVRRILVLSIDGQGAQDSSIAQHRAVGGVFSLFGLVSGAQIDRYNFETLTAVTDQVHEFAHAIAQVRCGEAKVIDGARCDDVDGALIHISLAAMPEGPEKAALLAIPTGLTRETRRTWTCWWRQARRRSPARRGCETSWRAIRRSPWAACRGRGITRP